MNHALPLLTALLLAPPAGLHAVEPWWREYTPVATVGLRAESLETIQPGAARGVGTLGWYGFWFLDAQEKAGYCEAGTAKLRQASVKRIVYYDLGEVGDYAAFFTADGKMKHNGWSLPWWDGKEPLTARWLGLEAFLRDVPWAPFPSAKAYGLPPFTTPDGKPADDLYAVLARRGLDGQWSYDYSSNPGITDDFAQRSGLAELSDKQSGPADTQGKSGWQMTVLHAADGSNSTSDAAWPPPRMRDLPADYLDRLRHALQLESDNFDNPQFKKVDVIKVRVGIAALAVGQPLPLRQIDPSSLS